MTTRILGIVVAVACSISGTAEAKTNLKPLDPVALQGVLEATGEASSSENALVRFGCAECGGQVYSVKPWRMEDVLGKPLGRRG